MIITFLLGLLAFFSSFSNESRADWVFLPESRHHQFQGYSSFIDQQNIVVFRGQNRYWAAVALNVPLVGNNELASHPQLVFHISGNDSMHVNEGGGVFTETLDSRIGFMAEGVLPWWELKVSLGYLHESGHTVDGTDDPSLNAYNSGVNFIRLRVLRDFERKVRAGFTISPITLSIPDNIPGSMGEFVEYFPFGSKEDPHSPSPFIALGLQNRFDFSANTTTYNAQMGAAFGSHFEDKHTHDLRVVIGYYRGGDPRAKYSQYEHLKTEFGYLGVMFNL